MDYSKYKIVEPGSYQGEYLTLDQAAFVLQHKPETLKKWIEEGKLKRRKAPSPDGEILIHTSEIDRYKAPWKHIWRLDSRCDAQQALVETLKKKVLFSEDQDMRIYNAEMKVLSFIEMIQRLEGRIVRLETKDWRYYVQRYIRYWKNRLLFWRARWHQRARRKSARR